MHDIADMRVEIEALGREPAEEIVNATLLPQKWDPPRLVFGTEFIDTPGISYDVSRDGQRLLVVKRARPVS